MLLGLIYCIPYPNEQIDMTPRAEYFLQQHIGNILRCGGKRKCPSGYFSGGKEKYPLSSVDPQKIDDIDFFRAENAVESIDAEDDG